MQLKVHLLFDQKSDQDMLQKAGFKNSLNVIPDSPQSAAQ